MSTHYTRSIPCPGAEFNLPPCEEHLTQHAVKHPDGWELPGDWIEEEEITPNCDCEHQVKDGAIDSAYWTRVWELLNAQEWELDDSAGYDDYEERGDFYHFDLY